MLWIILIILLILIALFIYFRFCKKEAPSTQVTNNAGTLIHMVRVGGVEFTENLSMCGDGCSTGFIDVPEGNNYIELQETSGGPLLHLGDLGPFTKGTHYAVNIKSSGTFCAELWKRNQTGSTFNDDTTKELIISNCS